MAEQRFPLPDAEKFDGEVSWGHPKAIRKHHATDQGEERIPALQLSDLLAYHVSWQPAGGERPTRYITIVALAFAFAGLAHGANDDLKPARNGGEDDTARKAAERVAQEVANAQIYWLDSAYRRSDGALIQEQRQFLRNKDDLRLLPPFSSLAECEAEAKYRMNWRGGKDSPIFERADCRPTAITRKMLNAVRKDHCWDDPKRPAWERPQCRSAVEALSNILERELKAK